MNGHAIYLSIYISILCLVDIFIRDGGKPFFEKNYDGGLTKAAENFEDEINVTNEVNEEKS